MSQPTIAALPAHFASLPDPWVVGRTAYPLENIIFIAVPPVICGVDTYTGMAVFAQAKRAWLAQYLDLSSGLPSHDTLRLAPWPGKPLINYPSAFKRRDGKKQTAHSGIERIQHATLATSGCCRSGEPVLYGGAGSS